METKLIFKPTHVSVYETLRLIDRVSHTTFKRMKLNKILFD